MAETKKKTTARKIIDEVKKKITKKEIQPDLQSNTPKTESCGQTDCTSTTTLSDSNVAPKYISDEITKPITKDPIVLFIEDGAMVHEALIGPSKEGRWLAVFDNKSLFTNEEAQARAFLSSHRAVEIAG